MHEFQNPFEYKIVYVISVDARDHDGCLKIGETSLKSDAEPDQNALEAAAHKRIKQFLGTAAVAYRLLHVQIAVDQNDITFSDHDVHRVLRNSKIKPVRFPQFSAQEWFRIEPTTALAAIRAVVERRENLSGIPVSSIEKIIFRAEQLEAIKTACSHFKKKTPDRVLWNAKMRFGKTLCALEVIRRCKFARSIIVTHRPVVNEGWFDDFRKIFAATEYIFGSKNNGEASVKRLIKRGKPFVFFASMQDLRGSELVGGNFDKHAEVFNADWQLVIVDEAHEGTQTTLGDNVIRALVKSSAHVLMLSGTPFNLIDDFDDSKTFTWSYVDEQREKAKFAREHPDEFNPYEELPRMNIFTYDLGKLIHSTQFVDLEDKAFNFAEFFKVDDNRFAHHSDVLKFLDLLSLRAESKFPFANQKFREMFRHTLWILPGVDEAKTLADILKEHVVFRNFEIVCVAGSDETSLGALDKVKSAIENCERTITVSCRRLTVGVTVPEWTAVLMLGGAANVSAMNYMQTIFRVQSPCKRGGKLKTECFVFDFAPDRILKVLAEVAASDKRGNGKTLLGEFLNFAPVIAYDGSRMKEFRGDDLFRQLNRVNVEKVFRAGFDSQLLFNLSELGDIDIKNAAQLKKIFDAKLSKTRDEIVINDSGLDKEKREPNSTKQKKSDVDPMKKRRDEFVKNLRAVASRLPLMIYGADVRDDEISIDGITELVDDRSWEEFMPRGLSKELFGELVRYFDADVFAGAARRIRDKVRAADDLSPPERINEIAELFSTFKNPDKETVLTPWRVVKMHLHLVLGSADDETLREVTKLVFNEKSKVLDINSKTGLYPLYVAQNIWRQRCRIEIEQNFGHPIDLKRELELWQQTVEQNVFALCRTETAAAVTRRTLIGFVENVRVNVRCMPDIVERLRECFKENYFKHFVNDICSRSFWKEGARGIMKFDAVVGNPPYQSNAVEGGTDLPVYHYFIEAVEKIAKRATLIHPARFLFEAGATPKKWNKKVLLDKHWKIAAYEIKSQNWFPSSDIKGGVAITYYDKSQNFGSTDLFIPIDELRSIHQKVVVDNRQFQPLSSIVFSKSSYRFTKKLHEDHPDAAERLSAGHEFGMTTNVFARLPDIFTIKKPDDGHEYSTCYGFYRNHRAYRYIRRDYINEPENFLKYKVLLPASNGSGAIGETLSSPLVSHTETFLSIGSFDSIAEAEAAFKYIKTKFCRVMLGILKVTQHNPPSTWAKVPLQDFTAASDIDWTLPIAEIDRQLYRKYDLTSEEIEFIEARVKAMD